jgi:hypothetical protein
MKRIVYLILPCLFARPAAGVTAVSTTTVGGTRGVWAIDGRLARVPAGAIQ